jgi:hypothetical protein
MIGMNMSHSELFFARVAGSYSSDRLSYIGKEKDSESNLGDFGVRKYGPDGPK